VDFFCGLMLFVFFGARERQPVVKPHKYQTKTATAQASAKKKNLVPA